MTSDDCAVDTAFLPFENNRDYYVKLSVKNIESHDVNIDGICDFVGTVKGYK